MRKRLVALVALLGLAMTLGGRSAAPPATATAHPLATTCTTQNCYSGYEGSVVSTYFDQALAYWDVPLGSFCCPSNYGFTRWVGLFGPRYGTLFQAGIAAQYNTNNSQPTPFLEFVNGDCPHILQFAGFTVNYGDRVFAQTLVLDDTHWQVIFTDVTTGNKWNTGSQYCGYAWEYRGLNAGFIDERYVTPVPCDLMTGHDSNDILTPRVHYVGEGGNVYHYLGELNNQTLFRIADDDVNEPLVEYPGAMGSQSNFLESFVWNGDEDPC